jgi:6-pyruvoyltetrahydropterin/6-carboxytetrahydropterin synthase
LPYYLKREVEFDAGHRVPNHQSKCRNPHGHRYKVQATVTGQLVDRSGASDEGMVIDFGEISDILQVRVHNKYDHGFIMYEKDDAMRECFNGFDQVKGGIAKEPKFDWKVIVVDWIPTAENMAKAIFEDLFSEINHWYGDRAILYRIDVFETPKSVASYSLGSADG